MNKAKPDPNWKLMGVLFQSHPWHGVPIGDDSPEIVTAYIEIVPTDTVKYELDKSSGLLKIDRPQRFSNVCPTNYGFVPQTYCGEKVAELFGKRAGRSGLVGDGDPLDICVLSERPITRSEVIVPARVVGGLQLLDRGEADDKIIAVVEGDFVWGNATEIANLPPIMVERLQHYFTTYKLVPGAKPQISVQRVYGVEHAASVVEAAIADYQALLAGR